MPRHPTTAGTPATVVLTEAGVPFTLHTYVHDPSARSYGDEAAALLGLAPQQMFKTLLVDTGAGLAVGVVPVAGSLDLKAMAAALGAHRVELYTGPYAEAFAAGSADVALAAAATTARLAQAAGLAVNAGHDLDQANLGAFLTAVPAVQEVSIGHALISEALYVGLDATVRAYRAIVETAAAL